MQYVCPNCRAVYNLRSQFTLSKRNCGNCGCPITAASIGQQQFSAAGSGCFQSCGGCVLIFLFGIYLLSLLFGGRRDEPIQPTTKETPPKIVVSTESSRPAPTKPTPDTTKRDTDPPEPEITPPKTKPVEPSKEMPKEDEKPSPKVIQPSPKVVEPIPKKPARSGILVLRLREPARRGTIPFLEVDGKKVADWVEDSRSLTAIIESGSRQIAVKIPDGATDRVLMDRTMDVGPDKRTEVDVSAGK